MITSRPRESDDEFYVGYGDEMPPGVRRGVRAAVIAAACGAAVAAAVVLAASSPLPPSRFEFGIVTEMSGILRRVPYPVLETRAGRVWLVGPGKSGADRLLDGVADGPVTLRGSRIERARHRMLEVHAVDPAVPVTLQGEIVDSKCFLGVMNPAEGTVHRDCARRCLSGGIPPMLLVRDGEHREELVLLVTDAGRAIAREVAPGAGMAVDVTGRLIRDGKDFVLYVSAWRRQG
jgi:hypothetical protein